MIGQAVITFCLIQAILADNYVSIDEIQNIWCHHIGNTESDITVDTFIKINNDLDNLFADDYSLEGPFYLSFHDLL